MLALAVGYLLGGQFSVLAPSLRRLGLLLIAAGLATLPVVLFGNVALDAIFDRVGDPRYGSLLGIDPAVLRADGDLRRGIAVRGTIGGFHLARQRAIGRIPLFRLDLRQRGRHPLTSFYLVLLFDVNTILLGLMAVSIVLGSSPSWSGSARHEDGPRGWVPVRAGGARGVAGDEPSRHRAAFRALALSQHHRRRREWPSLHEVRAAGDRAANLHARSRIAISWCSITRR